MPITRSSNGAVRANTAPRIALVGYGEVGQTLGADLATAGFAHLGVWDKRFTDPRSPPTRAAAARGVHNTIGLASALAGRSFVISAVTAAECLAAAREAAAVIAPQAFYFDLNSVSPRTKREAAALIEAAGARYVEAAVMAPIAPQRSASPILIGGPHAAEFAPLARSIGFRGVKIFATEIGRASAAKMCRSVLIKGLEALLGESLLAARRCGVESTVLESLQDLLPNENWERLGRYMIMRSLVHGVRRAEEMREAAQTVADAGIEPLMSRACAERQTWAAQHRPAGDPESLPGLLDAVLGSVPTDPLECA